ncbi:unnamed protein product [Eretmochelys imbricata]
MCSGEISSGKAHIADRPGKPLGVLFWRRRGGRERMVRGGSEEVGGYRLLHTKEKSKEPITGSSLVIKGRARRLEGAGRKQLPELSLGRKPPQEPPRPLPGQRGGQTLPGKPPSALPSREEPCPATGSPQPRASPWC